MHFGWGTGRHSNIGRMVYPQSSVQFVVTDPVPLDEDAVCSHNRISACTINRA